MGNAVITEGSFDICVMNLKPCEVSHHRCVVFSAVFNCLGLDIKQVKKLDLIRVGILSGKYPGGRKEQMSSVHKKRMITII